MNRHDNAASNPIFDMVDLPDDLLHEFEQIIERFEESWRSGSRPEIARFLPPEDPLRLAVLHELVQVDFDYRCRAGDEANPAEYLSRFPELNSDAVLMDRLRTRRAQFRYEKTVPASGPSADFSAPAWSSIRVGTSLGNYTILECIGRGGMGAVYKAHHRRMNRVVALKTIAAGALQTSEAVDRFRQEVHAAARLDHPQIVTAYDADQFGDVHVLVMQFVDGTDMASRVRAQGPFPVELAVDCIRQAARGLEYAHRQGVIHRDIKPANLLLDKEGRVKILDMGLARIEESLGNPRGQNGNGLTQTGAVMGTVDFMAPEQALDSKSADARSDVYSLGCTLFWLLSGKTPFVGDTVMKKLVAHREGEIPRLLSVRPDIPEWLEAVFQRMLAKQPEDRFQTMSKLLAALPEQTDAAIAISAAAAFAGGSEGAVSSATRVASATRPGANLGEKGGALGSKSTTIRRWMLVAGALLITVPATYVGWQQFRPQPMTNASTAETEPQSAVNAASAVLESLEVFVRRGQDDAKIEPHPLIRAGAKLPPRALQPLAGADDLRIHAEFSAATNWYLVHVDPAGGAAVVATSGGPARQVDYPGPGQMAGFNSDDPRGMNVLLLVTGTNAPDVEMPVLKGRLNDLGEKTRDLAVNSPRLRAGMTIHASLAQLPHEGLDALAAILPASLRPAHAVFIETR